jgi:hypothetical protein
MTAYSMRSARSANGNWLVDSITRNPEGVLLLAAGCALLMRKATSYRSTERAGVGDWSERNGHVGNEATGTNGRDRNLRDTVADAARSVGEYASDVSDKVTETASGYASSVVDYAGEASERTRVMAQQAGSTLQSSAQKILREQPLVVAAAGLAVGAAVAAAFPPTDIERRNLGPTGERLKDAALKAGEQIKGAGMQAKEKLADVAEEHGLTAQGLKGMAQEVTDAFSDALSDDRTASTSGSRRGSASQVSEASGHSSPSRSGGSGGNPPQTGSQNNPAGKRGAR